MRKRPGPQGSGQEPLPTWWFWSVTAEVLFVRCYRSLFKIEKNSLSLAKMADCSDELVPGEFTDSRKGCYEPESRGWKASLRLKTLFPNVAKKVRVIARFRRALHT